MFENASVPSSSHYDEDSCSYDIMILSRALSILIPSPHPRAGIMEVRNQGGDAGRGDARYIDRAIGLPWPDGSLRQHKPELVLQ